jgi:hypothetical protein
MFGLNFGCRLIIFSLLVEVRVQMPVRCVNFDFIFDVIMAIVIEH